MKNNKSFLLGIILLVIAVLAELTWIRTDDTSMAIYTLWAALSAAAMIGHGVRRMIKAA